MDDLISISKASKLKGVSISTLRRWESEGKIKPVRTLNGHRRYSIANLLAVKSNTNITIAYSRVSSAGQKEDLIRQQQILELYCSAKGWEFKIISDIGSGLNYHKKGLQQLIKLISLREIERLVLTDKDILLRFGSELVFNLCQLNNVEVVIINQTEFLSSYEEDLAKDVLEKITVFSAKLYGSRSKRNRKLMEELNQIASRIQD